MDIEASTVNQLVYNHPYTYATHQRFSPECSSNNIFYKLQQLEPARMLRLAQVHRLLQPNCVPDEFQFHWMNMSLLSNQSGLLQPSSDKLTNPQVPAPCMNCICSMAMPSICTAAASAAAWSSMSAPGRRPGRSPWASSCSPPGTGSPR